MCQLQVLRDPAIQVPPQDAVCVPWLCVPRLEPPPHSHPGQATVLCVLREHLSSFSAGMVIVSHLQGL